MTHNDTTLQDIFQSFVILLSTDDGHWKTERCKISFKCVIIFIEKECKAKKELKKIKQEKSIIGRKLVLSYIIYKVLKKYTQECCEISKANQYGFMITWILKNTLTCVSFCTTESNLAIPTESY